MTKASKICKRIVNYIKTNREDVIVKAMVELEEYLKFIRGRNATYDAKKNAIDELSTTRKPN